MMQADNTELLPMRRVPPVPAPPHDPLSLLLAGWIGAEPAIGWRVRHLAQAEIAPGGRTLVLAPAPGAERSVAEASGSFGGRRLPINMALAPDGGLLLVDPISGKLERYDECACAFVTLRCTSVALKNPAGAAAGLAACGVDLFVADPHHARIVRWDLRGPAPRGELRLPTAASAGRPYPWAPFSLAIDGHGRLLASDPLNQRIDRFDARGHWQRSWTTPRRVWHIAVDGADRLLALVGDATGLAALGGAAGAVLWQWQGADDFKPQLLRWDGAGDTTPTLLPLRSDTLADLGEPPVAVDADGRLHLPCAGASTGQRPFDARGDALAAEAVVMASLFRRRGSYFSAALDSAIDDCTWHRVELRGCVPEGCSIAVRATTATIELTDAELADLDDSAWTPAVLATGGMPSRWDALLRCPPGRFLWLWLELRGDGFATPCLDAALVEYPRISLRRYLPAVFGADPVSADFTDRFTALFDASLRSIEKRLDTQAALFDPLSTPARGLDGHADFLGWLASWIGVAMARDWPEERRRRYLKAAASWYAKRGTPEGLHGQLLLLLGLDRAAQGCKDTRSQRCRPGPVPRCVPLPLNCGAPPLATAAAPPPLILEHFKLRRWLFAGSSRLGDDSVLWGERIVNRSRLGGPSGCGNAQADASRLIGTPDPYHDPLLVHANRISLFVPACVKSRPADERALRQLLATEVPAHVAADIQFVEPRFRVGVQAMVGLDSVIARTPQGVVLDPAAVRRNALGRDTVLTGRGASAGALPARAGSIRVGGANSRA